MTLYSRPPRYPAPLPDRIRLSSGLTRTDPSTFTPEEIADAGYVAVSPAPTPEPHQVVQWSGTDWLLVDKTAEELAEEQAQRVAAVKAEAYRRIVAICPEWRQRNLTAQAAQLAKKGETNWTQDEADAWAAGELLWAQISAIRLKSDEIEAMDPIPSDFELDVYWE